MWLPILQMTRAFADVQPAPHDKLFAELRREGALVLRPLVVVPYVKHAVRYLRASLAERGGGS